MNRIIYILLLAVLASCSKNSDWTSWSDITIETENGYSFNFIKDRMDESAIVPYDWKLNL